jgi:transposase-like protein
MVAETLEPWSSVSIVARRHDVNTNQLFKWRREMLPKEPPAATESGPMLPVENRRAPGTAPVTLACTRICSGTPTSAPLPRKLRWRKFSPNER